MTATNMFQISVENGIVPPKQAKKTGTAWVTDSGA